MSGTHYFILSLTNVPSSSILIKELKNLVYFQCKTNNNSKQFPIKSLLEVSFNLMFFWVNAANFFHCIELMPLKPGKHRVS